MSRERRHAFDVTASGMGVLSLHGRWLSVNDALSALVDRAREEILSSSLEDLTHPDDVAADIQGLDGLLRREISVFARDKRLMHRSGTPIWVLQQVSVSFDDRGRPIHFIWNGHDVTERRRVPAVLTEAEERLRVIVANAPIILWAVDPDGVFTSVAGSALDGIGPLGCGMVVGRSALELYGGIRVIEGGGRTTTGESLLRRALAGESCAGVAEIGDARYDTRMVPMRGPSGELAGVIGVATDGTERLRAEAHLLQTDRLTAVGTLASGVAREIDSPLIGIVRNLELVAKLLNGRAEECRSAEIVSGASIADTLQDLAATLQFARESSERVRRVVQDLTTFAGSGSEQHALLDVRAVLGPVLKLVSPEIGPRARFVQDLGDVPLVDINGARLGQVFMNLLVNAVQAIPEGDAERHEIRVATYTDEGGRAVFEVRDTGSGMPEDVVHRIFEPFFTTGPDGVRTGLGLSICHGIVTALRGEISVESSPGAGSVFRVAIPAASLGPPG